MNSSFKFDNKYYEFVNLPVEKKNVNKNYSEENEQDNNEPDDLPNVNTKLRILPDPEEDETTQIPGTSIEIAANPEEHEKDKEDLAMVAESKLYKLVVKDLFEYLKK